MRSQSVAWLLRTAGLRVHVLRGGYKRFRHFVLASFERPWPLVTLGGKTGSGKTEVLACLRQSGEQVLDLEHLARHRGSAFGGFEDEPQPTREHFENRVAVALYHLDAKRPVWVEDESQNLGRVNVPAPLYQQLRAAPLALIETPEDARLARVLREYGNLSTQTVADSLDRIQKKLGGLEHRRARTALDAGDLPTIARLLLAYYDRAYARQIAPREPFAVIASPTPEKAAEGLLDARRASNIPEQLVSP
jgi:tRNA 2-selenouridine synthase